MRESSPIVQFMALVEEFTPLKPVTGRANTMDDAMFHGGLFGLKQEHVFLLIAVGLAYALLVMK